ARAAVRLPRAAQGCCGGSGTPAAGRERAPRWLPGVPARAGLDRLATLVNRTSAGGWVAGPSWIVCVTGRKRPVRCPSPSNDHVARSCTVQQRAVTAL